MKNIDRRHFLGGALATGGALMAPPLLQAAPAADEQRAQAAEKHAEHEEIDFRFAPRERQMAYCFPDDPHKSVLGESGELLYGYDMEHGVFHFPLQFHFLLHGMKPAEAMRQTLDSPRTPIVRTDLEWKHAVMTLTAFATQNADEGRVDNVLMEIRARNGQPAQVAPMVEIRSLTKYDLEMDGAHLAVVERGTGKLLMSAVVLSEAEGKPQREGVLDGETPTQQMLNLRHGLLKPTAPYRAFFRIPQAGQSKQQLMAGLDAPEKLLGAAREFWKSWSPLHSPVSWTAPRREGEFLEACARNILQAREVRNGRLTFQVGPTCYRGLWVVDGNFLLEAARYLGYDKEAIEGLKTTWSKQQASGQIIAAGGREHYKDTAIAMFTLVRQCELSQDWSLLRELEPNVASAIDFLDGLRAQARKEGSALGGYGLLPRGFADGGIEDVRDELTNTLWAMTGLKAMGEAGAPLGLKSAARASAVYRELFAAFEKAAAQEMCSYEGRFDFLPMLLKADAAWKLPDPWDQPRPQAAQWALSHCIYPGRLFAAEHPVVRGHAALMQAVCREGIPAETGWGHHETVWSYNAAFVAEVYLWLGLKERARETFVGFLNHASPLYCWREEHPLQDALVGSYVGDMPHNWASAECIRYQRHVLALEDGASLRLLAGVTEGELAHGLPFVLEGTPTRFGRLSINLEPMDGGKGWRLKFRRGSGPQPGSVVLPVELGRAKWAGAQGAGARVEGGVVQMDPAANEWSASWRG